MMKIKNIIYIYIYIYVRSKIEMLGMFLKDRRENDDKYNS